MKASKLLDAREALVVCSRPSCPGLVQRDCASWLAQVGEAQPTVVLRALTAKGRAVLDARVTIDDRSVERALDLEGNPIPLDPGPHIFRFETNGLEPVEERAVLRAGEKKRAIVAHFVEPQVPAPALATRVHRAPTPPAVYLLGGLGLAASALVAFEGLRSLSDRSRYGCSAGCSQEQHDNVLHEYIVADVALGAAALAFGAAAWMYFTRGWIAEVSAGPAPQGAYVGLRSRF
jgi:hypothetical protein